MVRAGQVSRRELELALAALGRYREEEHGPCTRMTHTFVKRSVQGTEDGEVTGESVALSSCETLEMGVIVGFGAEQ